MDIESSAQDAFLDIATNLLAIILIVTLFSLVSVKHQNQTANHPTARPTSTQRFVEPQRDLFPPFSDFYFVVADRVAQWDQEAVVTALSAAPRNRSGTTSQGRYEWLPEPLVTRDIDTFQLRFFVDPRAILARETVLTVQEIDALVARLAASAKQRIAPVFLVHPDGMETFAPLYDRLQEAGVRFRWFAQEADAPLLLGRHPAQFTDYGIYW